MFRAPEATKKFGPEGTSKLAEDLIDAISDENSKQLFFIGNELDGSIKHQYKCHQLENLPDGIYELTTSNDENVDPGNHIGETVIVNLTLIYLCVLNLRVNTVVSRNIGGRYHFLLDRLVAFFILDSYLS